MRAVQHTIVEREAADVWDFLTSVERLATWVPNATEAKSSAEKQLVQGSTFTLTLSERGKAKDATFLVTDLVPPKRLVVETTSGPWPMLGIDTFELEPSGAATKVTRTMDLPVQSRLAKTMFFVLRPLAAAMMRRELAKELRSLKAQLEAAGATR